MRIRVYTLAFLLVPGAAAWSQDPTNGCELILHPQQFLGRVLAIKAAFSTDGIERALLTPRGCRGGIGVGKISDSAAATIDPGFWPPRPGRKVVGTFTGVITRVEPNTFTFYKDEGYRFDITSVVLPNTPPTAGAKSSDAAKGTSN
jgi:hypothetical protein